MSNEYSVDDGSVEVTGYLPSIGDKLFAESYKDIDNKEEAVEFLKGERNEMRNNYQRVKDENARLNEEVDMDAMTGLRDSGAFEESLKDYINKASRGENVSVMMVDMDDFKGVNDNYGHEKGDEVLKEVASALEDSIREYDEAFRYGGDEFTVVLDGTAKNDALTVADRIYDEVNELDVWDDIDEDKVEYGLSIGVVTYKGESGSDNEEIYSAMYNDADRAMYFSKDNEGVDITFSEYIEENLPRGSERGLSPQY